jgi:hypothetical protein
MRSFEIINRVRGLKPGASVIATVRDEKNAELPALAVQKFGRGRTAALLLGDVWRWGMKDASARADMDKGWRQLVRWLVTDVPNRVDCTAELQPADPNGAVLVQVRVRDEKFQAVDDATVKIEVESIAFDGTAGGAATVQLVAEPALSEPGLYEATYVPHQTGGYKATARVPTNFARSRQMCRCSRNSRASRAASWCPRGSWRRLPGGCRNCRRPSWRPGPIRRGTRP